MQNHPSGKLLQPLCCTKTAELDAAMRLHQPRLETKRCVVTILMVILLFVSLQHNSRNPVKCHIRRAFTLVREQRSSEIRAKANAALMRTASVDSYSSAHKLLITRC